MDGKCNLPPSVNADIVHNYKLVQNYNILHSYKQHIKKTHTDIHTNIDAHIVCVVSVAERSPSATVALVTGHSLVLRVASGLLLAMSAMCWHYVRVCRFFSPS